MATKEEEKAEQAFFAGKVKEQEEQDMKHTKTSEETEKYKDSLGQENPAQDLQRKIIEEKTKAQEEAEKNAKEGEKSEGA